MKDKKWLMATALMALSAAAVFATGVSEDDADSAYGPRMGRGPVVDQDDDGRVYGMRGGRGAFGPQDGRGPYSDEAWCPYYGEDVDFEVYEGTFSMVDGIYPALETKEGETFYLMPNFPIAGDDIPEDGAEVGIEALPSPMSPVHLMVFSATVDGEELEPDWDAFAYGPGRGGYGMGGFGGPRGMRGGPGMHGWYGGPGMRGGPGWYGAPPEDDRWGRRPFRSWEAPESE